MELINKFKFKLFIKRWRKNNVFNRTTPVNFFNATLVSVGRETYGGLYVLTFNSQNKLKIGNYCSIAPNVAFMLSADHYTSHISTFPFKVKVLEDTYEGTSKGNIVVDDDVWIGYGAVIMSGVHIGQGAVVAAGAVVTNDVPPYAIVGGVPAKVIRYRFGMDLIEELLRVDYDKLTKEEIVKHIDDLYIDLKDKGQLDWMPR